MCTGTQMNLNSEDIMQQFSYFFFVLFQEIMCLSRGWRGKKKKLIWHIWFGAQTLTERMSRCFSVRCDLKCSRFKPEPLEQKMISFGGRRAQISCR